MVKKGRLIKLTQQLIRINSENPPGDETAIVKFIKGYLKGIGLDSKVYEFKKNRPNIISVIKGRPGKKSLLISPHLDTVPAGKSWSNRPFAAEVRKNRIYGLGATDCKCNIASSLEAMHSLVEERVVLGYDLIFSATADEESGSGLGLIPLLEKRILKPDAAVVLDADDFHIVITQKGLMHIKIKIEGKKAHGAYPHLGVNAIDIAVNFLKELKERKTLAARNKYLSPPTLNIGTIQGGDKVNVVADWAEVELDFRFLPGQSDKDILQQTKNVLSKFTKKFSVEIEGIQDPYYISEKHPLVSCLKVSMRKFKIKPRVSGSEGATVITFFQHKNIPAVATGFGCSGCAHAADEFVKIENLYKGTQVLEDFFKRYKFN